MSIPNIPQDALVEILIKLPVKSLLRFRCVSKAWYSLISSPAFISTHTHLTNSPAKRSNLLILGHVLPRKGLDKFSLRFDDQSFDEYRDVGRPVDGSIVRIIGSCHGLICLSSEHVRYTPEDEESTYREETTVIWNPTLGISQVVPESSFTTAHGSDFPHVVGFGYDVKRNEYKIVKFPCTAGGSGTFLVPPWQFEVFGLSQNAWRIVTPTVSAPYIFDYANSNFLNGSLHWVGGPAERTIVAFDLAEEAFREMKLPGALNVPSTELKIIVKQSGYLSVMRHNLFSPYGLRPYAFTFDIWVMKEYGVDGSWSRLFTIQQVAMGRFIPAGFRTNGELLVEAEGGRLASYDCSTNEISYLGLRSDNPMIFVGEFVETLVLLKARGF